MASERGGVRRPSDRSPKVSGIGKNSKRTDTQAIRSPNVQDSTDLQVGDRERIRQGQKTQPLSETRSPQVSAAPPSGGPLPAGGGGAELPAHLMSKLSTRPNEDEMTPASEPPVEPQDDKEVVLQFLIDAFGDQNASSMLEEIRTSKQAPVVPTAPTTLAPEVVEEPGEPEAMEFGEDLATEGAAAGEEVDQTSVETPAAPSEAPVV